MKTITVRVAQTAPVYDNERDDEQPISVSADGTYTPHHIGDIVMTKDGYAEVIAVTDHECTALQGCGVPNSCGGDHLSDECCIDEITAKAEDAK